MKIWADSFGCWRRGEEEGEAAEEEEGRGSWGGEGFGRGRLFPAASPVRRALLEVGKEKLPGLLTAGVGLQGNPAQEVIAGDLKPLVAAADAGLKRPGWFDYNGNFP